MTHDKDVSWKPEGLVTRRSFMRGAGLAALTAAVGGAIPYHKNLPKGFVPAALAAGHAL